MASSIVYTGCNKPRASDYHGRRFNFASWSYKPHFFAGKLKRANNDYNRCVENLALGRRKIEIDASCDINPNTGKYQCNVKTGPGAVTNPSDLVGASQAGLGQDQGSIMEAFKKKDTQILIGAGVVLLLLMRRR